MCIDHIFSMSSESRLPPFTGGVSSSGTDFSPELPSFSFAEASSLYGM